MQIENQTVKTDIAICNIENLKKISIVLLNYGVF